MRAPRSRCARGCCDGRRCAATSASGCAPSSRRPSAPRTGLSAQVPISRRNVAAARAELLELSDRLLGPDPVDVRGVARVRVLLGDGLSPVYGGPAGDDLARVVRLAIDDLGVWWSASTLDER